MKEIKITNYKKVYAPHIISIADEQLGEGYLQLSTLEDVSSFSERFLNVAVNEKEEVLGFSFGSIVTQSFLTGEMGIPAEKLHVVCKDAKKIGVFKTVAVKKNATKMGIGARLTTDLIEKMKREKAEVICSLLGRLPME
ncbi:hypothetical protein PRVXT_002572 [Proteinivorax tanatarense]|uniref:N-acetyltransferase domain-containing protein n=1 Tax=Proteinivorax tanatarense TaxID=1260629 RepID=A0AAU7VKE0_9FIRM